MEATKLENKIKDLEKNKTYIDRIQENHKELIKKTINQYENHNKNSKVLLKKLIRLLKFKWWWKYAINWFDRNICV